MSIRVLQVDNLPRFWTRMDRNYRTRYEHLKNLKDFAITFVDIAGEFPELDPGAYDILLVGVFGALTSRTDPPSARIPGEWLSSIPKRCVMVEDLRERFGQSLASLFTGHYQYLISTYDCAELDDLRRNCSSLKAVHVIPHHIDTSLYREFDLPKIYDVLTYGNTDANSYPFRRRLQQILAESEFVVRVIPPPDKRQFDESVCGEALAKLINQAWLTIATPSVHDYLLAKYFEIAACGSVVAGQMASQGREIWQDRYVPLDPSMGREEILSRIGSALQDKPTLQKQSAAMSELVRQDYSLDRYIDRMSDVIHRIHAN